MYNAENGFGTDLKREPQSVKVRIAKVMRVSGETMLDAMNSIKALTESDLADFKRWFEEAGYPCT